MNTMADESICEFLDWDSQFFGHRMARVRKSRLGEADLPRIQRWSDENLIDCLYFLADSSDATTERVAAGYEFRCVDVRMTLDRIVERNPAPNQSCGSVRTALEKDIPALKAIAKVSHRDSRFYWDGNFPSAACDGLYETWIEKSCRGWANVVLVAEEVGEPVGYISCHLTDGKAGKIGLVGLAERAQGKGLGQALVNEALSWFQKQSVETVSVVTQGRNVRALRLYERCGFVTRSVELWFHKWFVRK